MLIENVCCYAAMLHFYPLLMGCNMSFTWLRHWLFLCDFIWIGNHSLLLIMNLIQCYLRCVIFNWVTPLNGYPFEWGYFEISPLKRGYFEISPLRGSMYPFLICCQPWSRNIALWMEKKDYQNFIFTILINEYDRFFFIHLNFNFEIVVFSLKMLSLSRCTETI